MLFSPEKCLSNIAFAVFLVFIFSSTNAVAQTKKKVAAPKKTQTVSKKETKKTQPDSKTQSKKTAAKADKNAKPKPADRKEKAEDKKRADKRSAEENKRRAIDEAKRRAGEEEHRRQVLAEQRRRAEAAREAQARRVAFERGLRTETIENIKDDDTDGEDLEVRRAAVSALGTHAGTIVVMEPQTGKVLSIVNQDWAIRKSFKPCSTIKLVTAVAGINEKVITENGNIRNRNFPLNLDDALAFSNNSYFQKVGANLGTSKMITYAQMLGLGQPTGINAKDETGGRLPFGNNNARIYSHGDDFEVTPLQLGVVVSAISNGGKIVVPQVPRTKYERANFRGAMRYQLNLPNNNFKNVVPGMIGAAQYGTARRGVDSSLGVAGKTGSCIGQGSWVGLFASVAPIENPKIAVVVITRGQGERGKYAAAIAGKIYQSLKYRLAGERNENIAKIPLELKPQTRVNAKVAAQIDEIEGEDSEDNDAAATVAAQPAPKPVSVLPSPRTNVKKQPTPAELFPTIVVKVKKSSEPTRPRIVPNK